MSRKPANIDDLGELHSLLTSAHVARLKQDIEDGVFTDAATLSAIAKFLADNKVFASPAEQDDLKELREKQAALSRARKARAASGSALVALVQQDLAEEE